MRAVGLALALAAVSAATEPATLERGGLGLRVPDGWHESAPARTAGPAVTVRLGPRGGTGFELLLTVMPQRQAQTDTRAQAEAQGRKLLPQVVETSVSVRELRGEHAVGHYFELSDRAPAPGEFAHMLQGVAAYGTLQVTFTLLTHDAAGPERAAAVELVRTARPLR